MIGSNYLHCTWLELLSTTSYLYFFCWRSLYTNCFSSSIILVIFSLDTFFTSHLISQGCSCHENFLPFILTDWQKQWGIQCQLTIQVSFSSASKRKISSGKMHTSVCFKIVIKCKFATYLRFKFKDFSKTFKYFQAPRLFPSTFKGLDFFYSKFKHIQGFLKHAMNPVLQPLYGPLDFVRDYPGEPASERYK